MSNEDQAYSRHKIYALCSPPVHRSNSKLRHTPSIRSENQHTNGHFESPKKAVLKGSRPSYQRPSSGFDEPRKKIEMPVSVKVYYGIGPNNQIRRFTFRPEQYQKTGIYANLNSVVPNAPSHSHMVGGGGRCIPSCSSYMVSPGGDYSMSAPSSLGVFDALLERIHALFNNALNMDNVHLCWKDDDGDYVIFSSDDELRVAINNTTDNTLRIYIRDREENTGRTSARQRSGETLNDSSDSRNATEVHFNDKTFACVRSGSERFVAADLVEQDGVQQVRYQRDTSGDRRGRRLRPNINTATVINHQSASNHQPNHHQSSDISLDDDEVILSLTNHMTAPPTLNLNDIHLCSHCNGESKSRAGVWYKCTVCNDFYLCSECENKGLHDQHIMVRTTVGHSPTGQARRSPQLTPSDK